MTDSPRIRRLRSDKRNLDQLRHDSTIIDFTSQGDPPDSYRIKFSGKGLWRPEGTTDVFLREYHEVTVQLGASYPRMMPELAWRTPIFHPNISAGGVVCLGGYGTHWVPSVNIDELCNMLWDMIRYQNFDIESPYNREAATWAKNQTTFAFPLDPRPLRDRVAGFAPKLEREEQAVAGILATSTEAPAISFLHEEVIELEEVELEVVEAELVEEPADTGIIFID